MRISSRRSIISLALLAGAAPIARGAGLVDLYSQTQQGSVTFDGQSESATGHCSLGPPTPKGIPAQLSNVGATTGVSTQLYGFRSCGMCLQVTMDDGKQVVAFVNDECVSCGWGDLNLGVQGDGRKAISWKAVACETGANPIAYTFEAGDQYYLKVQARTVRCPIDSFKIQLPNKGWVAGQPTVDNHWTFSSPDNPIPFPLPVQLTSIFGDTVTDTINAITHEPTPGAQRVQFICKAADSTAAPKPPAPAPVPAPVPVIPVAPAPAPVPPRPVNGTVTSPPPRPTAVTDPNPPAPAAGGARPPVGTVTGNSTTVKVTYNGPYEVTETCTVVTKVMG